MKKINNNVNENNFNILFKDDITKINEFSIELKRKEEDLKTIVESLYSIIKIQGEKINKLEEEKIESNDKIKELENEIKEMKENLLPLKKEKDKEEKFDKWRNNDFKLNKTKFKNQM